MCTDGCSYVKHIAAQCEESGMENSPLHRYDELELIADCTT
jgi:hypothetical protein